MIGFWQVKLTVRVLVPDLPPSEYPLFAHFLEKIKAFRLRPSVATGGAALDALSHVIFDLYARQSALVGLVRDEREGDGR